VTSLKEILGYVCADTPGNSSYQNFHRFFDFLKRLVD
jgi:hypothetical protein